MTESAEVPNGSGKQELSSLELKITTQIEFYFGDKNLQRDKFLRQKAEEDDGWVTLECLATFNRLKTLSPDVSVIASAIKKSNSDLIELDEDLTKVRRLKTKPLEELTAEGRQFAKAKTVYCKGFPTESTLDEIQEFFATKGKIVFILMRRVFGTKEFKGSVFVEFTTVEEAKAFLEEETKYKDEVLIKKTKEDYYAQKNEERKKVKSDERKTQLDFTKPKEEKEEKPEEEEELKYEKGSVLHFTDVGEQTSREDLKELFGEHEEIAWVDYDRNDPEGHIRFTKEGGAQRAIDAVMKANDGKVVIRNKEATIRVLEGDEEKEFFKKVQEERQKRRQRKGRDFGGRGRGRGKWRGRGGRGSWGGRKPRETSESEPKGTHTTFEDAEEGEPPAKQAKTED